MASGKKVRLTIVPCDDNGGQYTPKSSPSFEAMLNPSSYTSAHSIGYTKVEVPGKSGYEAKFVAYGKDKVNFKFVMDGTGVVEPAATGNSVDDQIRKLRSVVSDYQGENHEPYVVRILWGTFVFYGRLESMSIDYSLFKPSGEPLRATVSLAFVSTTTPIEEAKKSKRASPDLTHVVEFKAGDSLPLLCYRIYEDSAYYAAVARYNRITNFRAIKPGQKLVFPPLR